MKILSEYNALRRRRFLRFNILAALIVLLVTLFMIITGEYSSLQERKSADLLCKCYVSHRGQLFYTPASIIVQAPSLMDDQDCWSLALDRIVVGKVAFKLHIIMLIRHGLCGNFRLNRRCAEQSRNKKQCS